MEIDEFALGSNEWKLHYLAFLPCSLSSFFVVFLTHFFICSLRKTALHGITLRYAIMRLLSSIYT